VFSFVRNTSGSPVEWFNGRSVPHAVARTSNMASESCGDGEFFLPSLSSWPEDSLEIADPDTGENLFDGEVSIIFGSGGDTSVTNLGDLIVDDRPPQVERIEGLDLQVFIIGPGKLEGKGVTLEPKVVNFTGKIGEVKITGTLKNEKAQEDGPVPRVRIYRFNPKGELETEKTLEATGGEGTFETSIWADVGDTIQVVRETFDVATGREFLLVIDEPLDEDSINSKTLRLTAFDGA
ncbi:MAG: hypothetical protein GY836_06820, partial [Herbaspirillum sp.]|uniref:hypothetical protein n=1 Tax=Herbaspirillum sp. TaxID=1890675 RepID=UPI00258E681E